MSKAIKYRKITKNGVELSDKEITEFIHLSVPVGDSASAESIELVRTKISEVLFGLKYSKRISKDFEETIDSFIGMYPEIFIQIEIEDIENPESMVLVSDESEKKEKSINDIITRAASMILVDEQFTNHFEYKEDGRIVVRRENPPPVQDAHEIIRKIFEIKNTSNQLENFSLWTLGMMVNEFQEFYGDDFDPSVICESTDRNWNTISTSLGTYKMFWARRRNLSFTHHKEVAYAKIEDDWKEAILDVSEKFDLSVGDQRKIVSFVKRTGEIDSLRACSSKAEIETLIKGRSESRTFFFKLRDQWHIHNGVLEDIPATAHPIIDVKSKCLIENGTETDLIQWAGTRIDPPREPETPIDVEITDIT